jgi:hypothetical protein
MIRLNSQSPDSSPCRGRHIVELTETVWSVSSLVMREKRNCDVEADMLGKAAHISRRVCGLLMHYSQPNAARVAGVV